MKSRQTNIGKVLLETGKTAPGGKLFLLLSVYETLNRGQTSFTCKDRTWGYRMIFWKSRSMLVAEVEYLLLIRHEIINVNN